MDPAPTSLAPQLAAFPNAIELPVQWGDMDAFRHVNNVVYFRWFESGRVAHLQKLRGGRLRLDEPGPVLGRIDCRYRFPVTHPDTVVVATRFLSASGDRATLHHAVYSQRHQRLVAEGDALLVWVDLTTGQKAPIPPEMLAAMQRELTAAG
ncbi:MAG: acyl-CoA thioesterase [Verrucomicrobia bacterium]|nr:acyl-CoA thioesterase [Verrucomicrobiota bacterium]